MRADSQRYVVEVDMPDLSNPATVTAITLLLAVLALGGVRLLQVVKAIRARNGEANHGDGHDHQPERRENSLAWERRKRSCVVVEERAGAIETRVSVVEAGLSAVREDVAAIRNEAGDRHGEVMRAIGSITGEIRALRTRE